MGVFSFAAVHRGYLACRRRKRGTANAQRYEQRLLDHLVDTTQALQDRTYAPSRSLCFVARQPKAREIHAADFADRVVHHVLVPRLEALFEPVFIHDLYSNRQGKGTHAAVERLASFMRAVNGAAAAGSASPSGTDGGTVVRGRGEQPAVGRGVERSLCWGEERAPADGLQAPRAAAKTNPNRQGWFLQLDIRNFFNSIDQALLFRLINRRLKKAINGGVIDAAEARDLSWLTRVLLKQDLKRETVYRCTPKELSRVPPYKRLTEAPPGKGLPIGNLTSQFFANVYLDRLDQFVKHRLKCRYYLRYVDDFILLHADPAQLRDWERQIERFLADELGLALKPERRLRPVRDGADFLGYIVRPHYRLVRRRVVGSLRQRLDAFERAAVSAAGLRLQPAARERLRAVLASYLGHFAHADAHRLVQRLFVERPWLGVLFDRVGDQLRPRWQPPSVTSLRSQVVYFRRAFQPALILVQLGIRVTLFGEDLACALAAAPWIGRWRQSVFDTRNGLGTGRTWPLSHLKGLGKSLRRAGLCYGFVAEEGYLPGGMKRRVLRYLFIGSSSSRSCGRDVPLTLGPADHAVTANAPNPIT